MRKRAGRGSSTAGQRRRGEGGEGGEGWRRWRRWRRRRRRLFSASPGRLSRCQLSPARAFSVAHLELWPHRRRGRAVLDVGPDFIGLLVVVEEHLLVTLFLRRGSAERHPCGILVGKARLIVEGTPDSWTLGAGTSQFWPPMRSTYEQVVRKLVGSSAPGC